MEDIKNKILKFRDDRDWKQFHTPENLSKAISIEASELLEHFLWNNEFNKEEVCDELADVMIYCIMMSDTLNININDIIKNKLNKNNKKYPMEKAKGNSIKYSNL